MPIQKSDHAICKNRVPKKTIWIHAMTWKMAATGRNSHLKGGKPFHIVVEVSRASA